MVRSLVLTGLFVGCSAPERAPPWVEAQAAGAAYWPQNSRLAVRESLALGFEGIEVDVVLSRDGVPVLHRGPTLDPGACERADGGALSDEVSIEDLDFAELRAGYRCGGKPDERFPNAEILAEALMSFDELLGELELGDVDTVVHVDASGGKTESSVEAEAVLSRWFGFDLPQPFYVSDDDALALSAWRSEGLAERRDVATWLSWPPTSGDEGPTDLGATFGLVAGLQDLVTLAEEAEADGISVNHEVVERRQVEAAVEAGLGVQLWTVGGQAQMAHYSRWPVESLLSDHPGDAR